MHCYAADGTLVAERELTLQPWENLQDRLERLLGLGPEERAALRAQGAIE